MIAPVAEQAVAELPTPLVEGNAVRGYQIEDGALVTAPVWEDNKRGKNWLAVIHADPSAPGGLGRSFVVNGRGRYMYVVRNLKVGQAIEFAGDYYGGSGRKTPNRWYGVIRAIEADRLVCEKCENSKEAIALGRQMALVPTVDRAALEAERATLAGRMAEIDRLLAELAKLT